ncbi:hypothetical protein P280DRAFT_472748 [Massarina eburnea CBS 473.64]|uniref:Secreted protein n=1 Tax=Massarina eburnea CBS 473.64 TaxID=1395130 RepID=A0A6A6RNV4_9PLEO|nr:hypothetical protein P280DRAFT_472748 [Massarina eburnea CBS 473.64]
MAPSHRPSSRQRRCVALCVLVWHAVGWDAVDVLAQWECDGRANHYAPGNRLETAWKPPGNREPFDSSQTTLPSQVFLAKSRQVSPRINLPFA